jgi:transcriptional regulator with XRE-family HTH domain
MTFKNRNRQQGRKLKRQGRWRDRLNEAMQTSSQTSLDAEINVGRRLQDLRLQQGLSIRSLAELSGLNFNTLSLIENEKTSPNVNTLQQLAMAMQVPIAAFFETASVHKDVVYQKSNDRPQAVFPQGVLEDLGEGLALGEATPLLMTLEPNTFSSIDAIVHTGQEFVYCLEGSLVYQVGGEEYLLEPGDSLIFQAHIPHRWENKEDMPSRSLLILCPSDESDPSVEQHLMSE